MAFAEIVTGMHSVALATFGEAVTYDPAGATAAVEVTGIFDEQYVLSRGSADAGVETLGPALFVLLEDLPVDPEDDEPTITIRGVAYRVTECRPDGMGGVVLAVRRTT